MFKLIIRKIKKSHIQTKRIICSVNMNINFLQKYINFYKFLYKNQENTICLSIPYDCQINNLQSNKFKIL